MIVNMVMAKNGYFFLVQQEIKLLYFVQCFIWFLIMQEMLRIKNAPYCTTGRGKVKAGRKISQTHQITKNQNQPQNQATTITITIPTNNTLPNHPTYFLFTLTISTSHTSNVLFSRFFDESSFFTRKLWKLFQYFSITKRAVLPVNFFITT